MSFLDDLKSESISSNKPTNPEDVFASLNPLPHYDYLRSVQTEFLREWYERKDEKDIIGILGTGTGKTLIGLLSLQSYLNNGDGPCAYICPNNQLVKQVCDDAKHFGINVVTFSDNSSRIPTEFSNSNAILVMTFDKLFNGKSIFGVDTAEYIEIGSLVIDDAHTSIQKAQDASTITIKKDNKMYNELISIFKPYLVDQQPAKFDSIISNKFSYGVMKVPYWGVCAQKNNLLNILSSDYDVRNNFNYPFILEMQSFLDVYIGSQQIDIKPYNFPVNMISSFFKAKHRLFLSATLSNAGSFISELDVQSTALNNPIKITSLTDTGSKWILAFDKINSSFDDQFMREAIFKLGKNHNILVLTPSNRLANIWENKGATLYTAKNINDLKKDFQENTNHVAVLANKYDGIDLPDDLCHIVVIDGKPNQMSLSDRSNSQRIPHSIYSNGSIIREVEQGMGRAVRSNSDYSLIFLLGNQLQDFISLKSNMFTAETQSQWSFFEKVAENICKIHNNKKDSLNALSELMNGVLSQSKQWTDLYKLNVQKKYKDILKKQSKINYDFDLARRKALNAAINKNYLLASKIISDYMDKTSNNHEGVSYELQATYTYNFDKQKSFDLQNKAHSINSFLFKSPNTIYSKRTAKKGDEGENFYEYIKELGVNSSSSLAIHIRSINDKIIYSKFADENEFRNGIQELGRILGFDSSQPESESRIKDGGPDNLWIDENNKFVIEDKNQATNDLISKKYVEQITNSSTWFSDTYLNNDFEPVLFHKSSVAATDAHTNLNVHVVSQEKLISLKKAINHFADTISQQNINYWNASTLQNLFNTTGLIKTSFINNYTVMLNK